MSKQAKKLRADALRNRVTVWRHATARGGGVGVTVAELCSRTGLSHQTVRDHMQAGVDHGVFRVVRKGKAKAYRPVYSELDGPIIYWGPS